MDNAYWTIKFVSDGASTIHIQEPYFTINAARNFALSTLRYVGKWAVAPFAPLTLDHAVLICHRNGTESEAEIVSK